jgi:hypothetical protein
VSKLRMEHHPLHQLTRIVMMMIAVCCEALHPFLFPVAVC